MKGKQWELDTSDSELALANRIISLVGSKYKTSVSLILGRVRIQEIVRIRQLAIYLVLKHTKLDYPGTAKLFDRDRATIYYSEEKIEEALKGSERARKKLAELEDEIDKAKIEETPSIISDFG